MTGTQPITDFRGPQRSDLEDRSYKPDPQLQQEIYVLKLATSGPSTSATWAPSARPRPVAFTTTKVPKLSGCDKLVPI